MEMEKRVSLVIPTISSQVEETLRAIEFLRANQGQFTLTGSRFFENTKGTESDWDYFCQDSEEMRVKLGERGFKLETKDRYNSPDVTSVYRLGLVHIQLVENVELKEAMQVALTGTKLFVTRDKQLRKEYWQLLCNFYRELEKRGKLKR